MNLYFSCMLSVFISKPVMSLFIILFTEISTLLNYFAVVIIIYCINLFYICNATSVVILVLLYCVLFHKCDVA